MSSWEGNSRKRQSFSVADVSQLDGLYVIELTGLKHPKTIGFRWTVWANIQGNGSCWMLMRCDCYPAKGLTLFKGQIIWERERKTETELDMLYKIKKNTKTLLPLLFKHIKHICSDTDSNTLNPRFLSHCSDHLLKKINPSSTSGSITSGESNCYGLLCLCPFDDLLKIDEKSAPGSGKIPSLPHHHDGENFSMIFRLKSVFFFLPIFHVEWWYGKWRVRPDT